MVEGDADAGGGVEEVGAEAEGAAAVAALCPITSPPNTPSPTGRPRCSATMLLLLIRCSWRRKLWQRQWEDLSSPRCMLNWSICTVKCNTKMQFVVNYASETVNC